MKEFIVGTAMFLLLMFFPVQYVLNWQNDKMKKDVDAIVNVYVQEARTTGRFTDTMITTMTKEISDMAHVSESSIQVNVTKTPKYRLDAFDKREMISYEIRVPVNRILAMASFFSIRDEDNKTTYTRAGQAASEVLPP